jgi:hypothetical protein
MKKMANKNVWLGILAITLVFTMTVVGCDDDLTGNETPPEEKITTERWSKFVDPSSTATLDYSVDSDGVCTITVDGKPEVEEHDNWNRWKAQIKYEYTAKANTQYIYEFEAWTKSDPNPDKEERSITMQYYYNNDNDWLQKGIYLSSEKRTFTIVGEKLQKGGVRHLEFHCADQLGTFYVKILSIEEASGVGTSLLNGTWVDEYGWQHKFNNGNYEKRDEKGTYTIKGNTSKGNLIMTPTHIYGSGMTIGNGGIEVALEDKWYSLDDLIALVGGWYFWDDTYNYYINGNKLTLVEYWWGEIEETYTKQE